MITMKKTAVHSGFFFSTASFFPFQIVISIPEDLIYVFKIATVIPIISKSDLRAITLWLETTKDAKEFHTKIHKGI